MARVSPPRLQRRIVAVFLALLLAVQLASLLLVGRSIDANARAAVAAQLDTGEKVLRRLIDQHSSRLSEGAGLLARDFGFLSAAVIGDQPTLQDALENQGNRIRASLAVYVSNQPDSAARKPASLVVSQDKGLGASALAGVQKLVTRVAAGADDAGLARPRILLVQGRPHVVVTAQVRAPDPKGWVAMGFALDRSLLEDMQQLSALKTVLFVRESGRSDWQLKMSTFEAAQERHLAEAIPLALQLPVGDLATEIGIGGSKWGLRRVSLADGDAGQVDAVLLRSLDEAVAPYWRLQLTLFALTALGLAIFAVGSVVTARRIVRPIVALSRSALRLGQGDYSEPIDLSADDEVGDLAQAFETMREGIRRRESEIGRLAYWDTLTGLPNRQSFRERVSHASMQSEGGLQPYAVLVLDVDRFKEVNDALGHEMGDHVLQEAAQRLQVRAGRVNAFVARLGGDEFAVLLRNLDAEQAGFQAGELLQAFADPLRLAEHTVDLGASLGYAMGPEHGNDADTLLRRAEIAMYVAKRTQAGPMAYSPSMDPGSAHSLTLLGELRGAVARNELRLYLQPKVGIATGQVTGAEALLRWQHPQRGLVPPMSFIPFAEQTGFIRSLTMWVLERSVQALQPLAERGLRARLSVNLSTRDLTDPDLPARIGQLLSGHGLPPQSLCLEITESAMMEDPQRALQTLQRLHDMGMRISIDDFGTGYSSLAYLKRLPVHELKIDRSFVMNMERDLDDAKIVRSTIDLAHNLGLYVVAEGVETLKTLKLLSGLRCDEAQGYLIARPMPVADFASWALGWKPPSTDGERIDTDFADIL